jgi:beta-lactamase regulating signal transducer with metallopeptidase domain
MEYLLKSSALIAVFYICYILFLQRETFFDANRWFLFLGLITSILFPLLVIPIYVDMPATTNGGFSVIATTAQTTPEPSFDLTTLTLWVYAIGVSFFLGRLLIQFLSLMKLINKNDKEKSGKYTYIRTSEPLSPFSFFKWIVFNPKLFSEKELELILQHEKIHASQLHSIDTVLVDLATALFWFNPFIWLYRKVLKQNLEFIADQHTQKQSKNDERYQKLLLKTSLPEQNLNIVNTFYNSSIRLKLFGKQITLFNTLGQVKKRIVMLHKSKSNLMNTWKYSIVVPLLVIFAMTFNTEIIAQTTVAEKETAKSDQQNILKFVVTKDTKDQQLDFIKEKIEEKGATIAFKNVKRNSKNEITGIKVAYNLENTKLVHSKKLSEPIKPIEISMNPSNGKIDMSEQVSTLSQTFNIETDEDGHTILNKSSSKNSVINITDENGNKEKITLEDGYTMIEKSGKKFYVTKDNKQLIITTDSTGTFQKINLTTDTIITPKSNSSQNSAFTISSGVSKIVYSDDEDDKGEVIFEQRASVISNFKNPPLYILDGKEISEQEMQTVDPNTIKSLDVIKNKAATKKYGKKGDNGVILITSKKDGFSKSENQEIIFENQINQKIIKLEVDEDTEIIHERPSNLLSNSKNPPLYIVDGKETTREHMDAINETYIASVFVLKGEQATKQYGKKGENGVIIVTTKKK